MRMQLRSLVLVADYYISDAFNRRQCRVCPRVQAFFIADLSDFLCLWLTGNCGLPFVGNTLDFYSGPQRFVADRVRTYGQVSKASILGRDTVIVAGKELLQQVSACATIRAFELCSYASQRFEHVCMYAGQQICSFASA